MNAQQFFDDLRMSLQKFRGRDDHRQGETFIRPEIFFLGHQSSLDIRHQPRTPRFGNPGGIDLTALHHRGLLGVRHGDHIFMVLLPQFLRHIMSRGDILCVAILGRGDALAHKILERLNPGILAGDDDDPIGRGAGDDPHRFALASAVSCQHRPRADIAHINRPGTQRFHERRACVKYLRLQYGRGDRGGKFAGFNPQHGLRMGDVCEVTQPHFCRWR